MYIIGASGHAKVVIDTLESKGVEIDGIFDDNPAITFCMDYPVSLLKDVVFSPPCVGLIAVGDNGTRERLFKRLGAAFSYLKVAHATAYVSKKAQYGSGTIIMARAVLQPGALVGKHSIINTGATIDHDCVLGDFVHLAPQATLCGGVKIGKGTLVGAGSTVVPGITIGANVVIGAGSTVLRNVEDGERVYGLVK